LPPIGAAAPAPGGHSGQRPASPPTSTREEDEGERPAGAPTEPRTATPCRPSTPVLQHGAAAPPGQTKLPPPCRHQPPPPPHEETTARLSRSQVRAGTDSSHHEVHGRGRSSPATSPRGRRPGTPRRCATPGRRPKRRARPAPCASTASSPSRPSAVRAPAATSSSARGGGGGEGGLALEISGGGG
jgi:hypothetical protein